MLIHGDCHCGNTSFDLLWEPDPVEIPARACGCTFCVRHAGVWTSNPQGVLTVSVRDPQVVSRYRFGTQTAEFQVCSRCGVVPLVTSTIDGRLFAVVNVNTFDATVQRLLRRAPASFDEENETARLARRKRNWIGQVHFIGPAQA